MLQLVSLSPACILGNKNEQFGTKGNIQQLNHSFNKLATIYKCQQSVCLVQRKLKLTTDEHNNAISEQILPKRGTYQC